MISLRFLVSFANRVFKGVVVVVTQALFTRMSHGASTVGNFF